MRFDENPYFCYKKLALRTGSVAPRWKLRRGVTPEEVLEHTERVAIHSRFSLIGPMKGKTLDPAEEEHKPDTLLEARTMAGYSAIRMGRHLNSKQGITHVALREGLAKATRFNSATMADAVRTSARL